MAGTAEAPYEIVRRLPAAARLRLVEKSAHDLPAAVPPELAASPFAWTQLAGAGPGLLGGDGGSDLGPRIAARAGSAPRWRVSMAGADLITHAPRLGQLWAMR